VFIYVHRLSVEMETLPLSFKNINTWDVLRRTETEVVLRDRLTAGGTSAAPASKIQMTPLRNENMPMNGNDHN
jgi:hypothetical protein